MTEEPKYSFRVAMTNHRGEVTIKSSPEVPRSQLLTAARIMEAALCAGVFGYRVPPEGASPLKAFLWKLRNAAALVKACTIDFDQTADGLRKIKECMAPVKAFCADEITKV